MKKYMHILIATFGLLLLQTNVSAQDKEVYLKSDRLFERAAAEKATSIDKERIKDFGQSAEKDISTRERPEREAAALLYSLEDRPERVINRYEATNASSEQKALQADKLISEYIEILLRSSAVDTNDPLREYVDKLKSSEGQKLLNEDLQTRLGMGVEREGKAIALIAEIRENFSKEKLKEIREALKTAKESAKLPYPLCLIKGPCPR